MDTGTQARLDLDIKQKIYMILLHQLGTVLYYGFVIQHLQRIDCLQNIDKLNRLSYGFSRYMTIYASMT